MNIWFFFSCTRRKKTHWPYLADQFVTHSSVACEQACINAWGQSSVRIATLFRQFQDSNRTKPIIRKWLISNLTESSLLLFTFFQSILHSSTIFTHNYDDLRVEKHYKRWNSIITSWIGRFVQSIQTSYEISCLFFSSLRPTKLLSPLLYPI